MRIALAQLNLLVGDIAGNARRIRETVERAHGEHQADLVICPELALCGYPPEDLLFHRGLRHQVDKELADFATRPLPAALLLGYPEYSGGHIFNAATLIDAGGIRVRHRKICLPNYRVFDEKRYFEAGDSATVVEHQGVRFGILICEDIWQAEPARAARAAGAEVLLVLNASPFELRKQGMREDIVRQRVLDIRVPVIYVNLVGGQDELVFDGNSFAMDAAGTVIARSVAFDEEIQLLELTRGAQGIELSGGRIAPVLADTPSVYGALVTGVRDYVGKHRFPGVVMGLSGGIDSALTLAIAADALGADKVHGVMMPSRYTADMSVTDAELQARNMGAIFSNISIENMFEATLAALHAEFLGRKVDTTEENIQSRCRMLILMGLSNKTGKMLLTTGNKSEMAVGYATLYGDMAGGFAPIKDCSKMLVYRLAEYRNSVSPVIPQRVIDRPPSAELRPDQKDSDSLPEYPVLDAILEAFIEEDLSVDEICARGFDRATVGRVLDLVKRNEYKRRQAPPGVRVSRRAFGRDWRYPITNGYRR